MDWIQVGLQIAKLGLPLLGGALGGPIGAGVGSIVARALGAADSPDAVASALAGTPPEVLVQKLKSAEAEFVALIDAQAKVAIAASADVAGSMKAELIPIGEEPGWFGMFQRGWRPLFAYELLIECAAMAAIFGHEIWTGDFKTITAMSQFQLFTSTYFGLRFGVLGVFGIGRSNEKVAAINAQSGGIDTGLIGGIISEVMKRLGH
jgi:hypothetical protein